VVSLRAQPSLAPSQINPVMLPAIFWMRLYRGAIATQQVGDARGGADAGLDRAAAHRGEIAGVIGHVRVTALETASASATFRAAAFICAEATLAPLRSSPRTSQPCLTAHATSGRLAVMPWLPEPRAHDTAIGSAMRASARTPP